MLAYAYTCTYTEICNRNIINRLTANNNNFNFQATTLCIISMEKIRDARPLIKNRKHCKMIFLLILLLIWDVLDKYLKKKLLGMKYACMRPLKMTSTEPIFAFMEIDVLPLIWKRRQMFCFWFRVFCSFMVPY